MVDEKLLCAKCGHQNKMHRALYDDDEIEGYPCSFPNCEEFTLDERAED